MASFLRVDAGVPLSFPHSSQQEERSGRGMCELSFKVPRALLLPSLWWPGLTQIATAGGDGAMDLAKTQGFYYLRSC